jgi:hypothetical protein
VAFTGDAANRRTCCVICGLLTYLVPAGPAEPPNPRLVVRIYNLSDIDPKILAQAARVTTEVFDRARITTEWKERPASEPEAHTLDFGAAEPATGCPKPLPSAELAVRIIPSAPPGLSRNALGFALPCFSQGTAVTVFADRAQAASNDTAVPLYRVLGQALAHEIGHVLLRSGEHAMGSIMKASWDRRDYQRMAADNLLFTVEQSEQMRRELQRIR